MVRRYSEDTEQPGEAMAVNVMALRELWFKERFLIAIIKFTA